jgi:hypothetical protein
VGAYRDEPGLNSGVKSQEGRVENNYNQLIKDETLARRRYEFNTDGYRTDRQKRESV